MTTQFLRKVSLVIGEGTQALDLSDLQFTFEVHAPTMANAPYAFIRIYNLSAATARQVVQQGGQIILSAGYEGNFGTIFQGYLTQAWIGRENGTDTFVQITGVDGDTAYNGGIVNQTIAAGSNALGRLGVLANAANVKLGTVLAPTNGATLPRGRVYFGFLRDHMRGLCGTLGANWSIVNGELEVISESAYKSGDVPVITSETGMIGVPEQTDIGISVRTLLNPSIRQNGLVQLDNASIQQYQFGTGYQESASASFVPSESADGQYKVLYLEHVGDTRGGDWYTNLVCYSKIINPGQLQYLANGSLPFTIPT